MGNELPCNNERISTMERKESSSYSHILDCYWSGQMSEQQWAEHMEDEVFSAWVVRRDR